MLHKCPPKPYLLVWRSNNPFFLFCLLYSYCGEAIAADCGRKGVAAYVILNMISLAADCLLALDLYLDSDLGL